MASFAHSQRPPHLSNFVFGNFIIAKFTFPAIVSHDTMFRCTMICVNRSDNINEHVSQDSIFAAVVAAASHSPMKFRMLRQVGKISADAIIGPDREKNNNIYSLMTDYIKDHHCRYPSDSVVGPDDAIRKQSIVDHPFSCVTAGHILHEFTTQDTSPCPIHDPGHRTHDIIVPLAFAIDHP